MASGETNVWDEGTVATKSPWDEPQGSFESVKPTPIHPEQSAWDVTGGAFEYGAADTAALLSRSVSRSTGMKIPPLEDFSSSMEDFKKSHPEYAPTEVQNTLDLISNPKALTSRIMGSAAYTGLMMGSSSIPAAGWLVTGLTAYGIESQRAYETAIQSGATEQEAETSARATGTANAIGQIVLSTKMLGLMKGEESAFASRIAQSTNSIKRAMGPAFDLSKDAAILGGINAIQGAIDDKIATDTYGAENRDPFNWDKRLQEGTIGAATSLLIGAPRSAIKIFKSVLTPEGTPVGQSEINVFDRDTALRFFKDNGVSDEKAKSLASIADSMASQFAVDTGQPKESFFSSVVNERNFTDGSNGKTLQKQGESVLDSFETDPALALKAFLKNAVGQFPADKVESLKKSIGVTEKMSLAEADSKLDSAMMRYLWNGEAVSPETVAPLEDLKNLLQDTYKNVSTLGAKKISPETKVILDSMLAPETDQIIEKRQQLERVKNDISKNFPPEFNPASVLSDEDLQSILEPIREEKVSHQFDEALNVTKETKETILRKPTRDELRTRMDELLASKNPPQSTENVSSEPLGMIEGLPQTRSEANLLVADLSNDLDRLRMGRLIQDDRSGVERRSENGSWLRDQLLRETQGDSSDRLDFIDRVKGKLDPIRNFFDQQSPLRRWENGKLLLDTGQEVKTRANLLDKPFQIEASRRFTSLNWRERKWLGERDTEGFTNLEKIIDQTIVGPKDDLQPNPRAVEIPSKFQNVRDLRDFAWKMNKDYARIATQQGQLMRFADGKWRPFTQPEAQRFLRLHTEEFRKIASNPSSSEWRQFLEYIKTLKGNEELAKMKTSDLSDAAQRVYRDSELRTNSALESARIFKVVPSEVPINGKKVQIFETDPLSYLQRASKIQASRLAWGKVVGQDVLPMVRDSNVGKIAKILEVAPRNDTEALVQRIRERVLNTSQERLQENLAKSTTKGKMYGPPNSAEATVSDLLSRLRDTQVEQFGSKTSQNVPDPLSDRKALADAIKIARSLRINLRPSRQDYLDNINSITATNMTARQAKSLKAAARQLEGVNIDLPAHELLSEVKNRLNEDTFSNVDDLLKRIDKESFGQAKPYAERVVKEMQGIPTGVQVSTIPRVVRNLTSLVGTGMTALRAVLHVAQPTWQVAPDAGVGNYLKAMSDVLLKHGDLEGMKLIAAIPETTHAWGVEKLASSEVLGKLTSLDSWAKTSRAVTNKYLGINAIMNFNNAVAGQAYRRFAQGLMNREVVNGKAKVTSSDVATLKGLGVSAQEIEGIKSGQMSNVTFAKIVQNGVERLGTNLPRWKMGTVESSPIGRMVFSFSSYAVNSGRLLGSFFQNNLIPAMKSKDPATMIRAGRDLLGFVGAAAGAGALTEILYSIPRGGEMKQALKEEDESVLHRGLGALMKIAFVGPAARFMESLNISGPDNVVLGMMPQLHAIGKLFSLLDNEVNKSIYGQASETERYGRYGFGKNVAEYLKSMNPAIREWGHTLDNAQYPDKPAYDETRAASAAYERKFADTISSPTPEAVDPEKDQVFFYLQRNDVKGAMTAAQDYYRAYFEKISSDPRKAMIENMSPQSAVQSLRDSLEGRAPIHLTENKKLDFLSSLPADRMRKYYTTDLKYRVLVDAVAPKERK